MHMTSTHLPRITFSKDADHASFHAVFNSGVVGAVVDILHEDGRWLRNYMVEASNETGLTLREMTNRWEGTDNYSRLPWESIVEVCYL